MELIIKKQSKRGDEILIPANTIQFVNTGIGIGQFMNTNFVVVEIIRGIAGSVEYMYSTTCGIYSSKRVCKGRGRKMRFSVCCTVGAFYIDMIKGMKYHNNR